MSDLFAKKKPSTAHCSSLCTFIVASRFNKNAAIRLLHQNMMYSRLVLCYCRHCKQTVTIHRCFARYRVRQQSYIMYDWLCKQCRLTSHIGGASTIPKIPVNRTFFFYYVYSASYPAPPRRVNQIITAVERLRLKQIEMYSSIVHAVMADEFKRQKKKKNQSQCILNITRAQRSNVGGKKTVMRATTIIHA